MATQLNLPDFDTRDREGATDCSLPSQITSADDALRFILAGNAYFTVRSQKTGTRYTFRVSRGTCSRCGKKDCKCWANPIYFVSLLTGPENSTNYSYLGMIKEKVFSLTRASKMTDESMPVRAFRYLYQHLANRQFPADLSLWHEGKCGRCDRKLTVPESVERGIGPECAAIMGGQ
jgi:hypothetical protein